MPRIPREVETAVVKRLYADADKCDWGSMTPRQHSAQYDRWVKDPQIGGKLTEYLGISDARVWIKDGPMKEWSRATSGIGKYSDLVDNNEDILSKVIRKALGECWEAVPDTLRVKPLRVTVRNGEEEAILTWAPNGGLKHMVWAALKASAAGEVRDWVICVTETFTKPTPANEKEAHARLAKRCGLRIVHTII